MNSPPSRSTARVAIASAPAMTALHYLPHNQPPFSYYSHHASINGNDTAHQRGRTFFATVIPFMKQTVYFMLASFLLLVMSIGMYAIAYCVIMPKHHATEPIYFDYNYKGCHDMEICPPTAIIDLASVHTQWKAHISDVIDSRSEKYIFDADLHNENKACDNGPEICSTGDYESDGNQNTNVSSLGDKEKSVNDDAPSILVPKKSYFIQIALTLPESEFNRQMGMFMVEAHLHSRISHYKKDNDHDTNDASKHNIGNTNEKIKLVASSTRPTMLPYQSTYVSSIKKSFLMIPHVLGAVPEARTVVIECFDHYRESKQYPMNLVEVRLVVPPHLQGGGNTNADYSFRNVQVWKAELRIGKELNPIQRFMKEWFYTSACIGIVLFVVIQMISWLGLKLWTRFVYAFVKKKLNDNVETNREFGDSKLSDDFSYLDLHGNRGDNFNSTGRTQHMHFSNVDPEFFDEVSDVWISTSKTDRDNTNAPDQCSESGTGTPIDAHTCASKCTQNDESSVISQQHVNNKVRGKADTIGKERNENTVKKAKPQKQRKKKHNLSSNKSELRGTFFTSTHGKNGSSTRTAQNSNISNYDKPMTTEAERKATDRVMRGDFEPFEIFTGE